MPRACRCPSATRRSISAIVSSSPIVELDGNDVHDRPIQSDSDKERDRELLLLGWHVIRVTWRHLHQGRAKLAADLRRLLGSKLR